ncbi:MAG: hypothetical protein KAX49_09250 [Halanaerobiales bacterium]|nr:hypothetical protein [Halanaerobiales bacterium]
MKQLKKKLLIGVFTASTFIGGFGNSAEATPLWYINYQKGITTAVGIESETQQSTKNTEYIEQVNQPTQSSPLNDSTKWYESDDYWRNKSTSSSTSTQLKPVETIPDLDEQIPVGVADEEQILFNLLNKERISRGLQPLKLNSKLTELARKKSKDMADLNYFSHTSPTYGSPKDLVTSGGVDFWIVGENIAKTSSAERANTLFMNSSVHRAAILNKLYTEVGIGMYRESNGTLYVTELFIGTR